VGGFFNKPPEMTAPPQWWCYVRLPSADRAAEVVKRLGGRVVQGPMEVPGGDRIAQCLDPQGAAFAVHSLPAAKPAAKAKPKKRAAAKKKRAAKRKPARKRARRRR